MEIKELQNYNLVTTNRKELKDSKSINILLEAVKLKEMKHS